MQHVRYFPFTFLSGAHGFALFAPYLIAVMAVWLILGRRRALALRPVPIPVRVSASPSNAS
jgi:hypothetical protein